MTLQLHSTHDQAARRRLGYALALDSAAAGQALDDPAAAATLVLALEELQLTAAPADGDAAAAIDLADVQAVVDSAGTVLGDILTGLVTTIGLLAAVIDQATGQPRTAAGLVEGLIHDLPQQPTTTR